MTAVELMEKIEGSAFSAVVNLASDFRTFLRILSGQPEVLALANALTSPDVARQVVTRLQELAGAHVDEAYEHPADAALAAYLWLLSEQDRTSANAASTAVLQAKQCWWARKMAEQIQRDSGELNGATVPTGATKESSAG
jgi:hypothetical protein